MQSWQKQSNVCANLCLYIHPRGAAVALIWSFFPCQQIRKGLWKRRIVEGGGGHHLTSVPRQCSSWHPSLFTLYFTCGINKGGAKIETRKPGSGKHIVWRLILLSLVQCQLSRQPQYLQEAWRKDLGTSLNSCSCFATDSLCILGQTI